MAPLLAELGSGLLLDFAPKFQFAAGSSTLEMWDYYTGDGNIQLIRLGSGSARVKHTEVRVHTPHAT